VTKGVKVAPASIENYIALGIWLLAQLIDEVIEPRLFFFTTNILEVIELNWLLSLESKRQRG